MREDEIEVVAEELAKIGGLSWYPGRPDGAFLRAVSDGYREQARAVIDALERLRVDGTRRTIGEEPGSALPSTDEALPSVPNEAPQIGAVVEYNPPGDRRSILCHVEKIEEGRAFLVPFSTNEIGWVALDTLMPLSARGAAEEV